MDTEVYSSTMPTPALGSRSGGTVCIYVVRPLFQGMGPTKTRSKLVLGVNTTTMRFISTTKTLKIHKADTLPAKFSTETTGPAAQGPLAATLDLGVWTFVWTFFKFWQQGHSGYVLHTRRLRCAYY